MKWAGNVPHMGEKMTAYRLLVGKHKERVKLRRARCRWYNNNSIQFFIIYMPSQQPQGQLQAQHSVDKNNYFMNKHNIKSKTT
jgi:hypothetical protein